MQNLGQLEDHNKLSYGGLEDWAQQAAIYFGGLENRKISSLWMDWIFIKGIQQVAIRGLEDYLKVSMLEGCIEFFIMQKNSTNCHLKGFKD